MSSSVPTGNSLEVVLDRMTRASNFASNGVYLAQENGQVSTIELYIRSAQAMLDEARETLEAVKRGQPAPELSAP